MRINTLGRKKILSFYLFLTVFAVVLSASAQCPTVTSPNQSFCDSQSPTIASLVATNNGGGLQWFATPTGGQPLIPAQTLNDGITYYADDNAGTCSPRPSVTVSIFSRPPAIGGSITFCQDSTIDDLSPYVIGNQIKWYSALTGGVQLSASTVLVDGATYYASQTNPNTGCETTRRGFSVAIVIAPVPTGNTSPVFCSLPIPTVSDLNATGPSIFWYLTSNSGLELDPTLPLVNGQTYYAESNIGNCPSISRLAVTVSIINPNNAGSSGQRRFCISDIPSTPPFNLFGQLGGTPENTGTWSGPLPTSNANLGTVDVSTLTVAGSPYVFTYSVSSSACPTATSTVTIVVLPLPTASVSVTSASVCSGASSTVNFTGTPGATITYTAGSGNQFITLDGAGTASITSNFTTTTTYTLISVASATTPSCTQSLAGSPPASVNVIALPTVTVNSPSVCVGASATVTATPGSLGNYAYTWTVPSGAAAPGNVASFSTTVAGTYSVVIRNTTTNCNSLSASGTVTINQLPTVTVNSPSVCPGVNATVTATPGAAGTYSYAWTVPAGATPPGNVPSFTTTVAGTYSVIITNTATTCVSLSASGIVTVNPLPTVTVNSPAVCAGASATVTATPGTPGNYSYAWTVPVGATAPGNVATFNTTVAGTYSVIITNTITNCVSLSASGTVTVNPLPTVTVNSPAVCVGASATVTATPGTPGTYTYSWTVPVGATNPGNVPTFSTTVAGTYSVIITNTTTICPSAPASGTVTINPLPTVTVNSPSICPGGIATITATPGTPGTYSYAWTVPAGATAPGNVATFTTTVAGVYTVIITNATTTCPGAPVSGTVIINPIPTVTVNSPTICPGLSATITATPAIPGNYSYVWTVPAGATNPGNVATFNTTISGTYTVVATNTTTTCVSDPASGTVTINPIPTVTVNSETICAGESVAITATPGTAGTYTYAWTVPAGATPPGDVATFNATVAGTYTVVITDPASTCPSNPASGTVTVNPLPTVSVSSTATCEGVNATITATPGTPGTYSYVWTVPTGVADPGNVATFTTTIAGTYSVSMTDLTTTCISVATASTTVTINPLPTVTVNSPSICPGVDATVLATPGTAGNYTYVWTVPAGATNPGNVPTFTTSVVGTYSVVITDTTTNCVSLSASGTVSNNPTPTVTVNSPSVCAGTNATVTASPETGVSTDYSYSWTVPAGATAPGNVDTFTTSLAGTYTVVITNITSTCVSSPASGTVTINPLPIVTVNSPSVCAGLNATITATPSTGTAADYSYVWTVPAGATNPGNIAAFTTTIGGTYSVVITNISTTCPSASASGTVTINPLPTATISSSGTVCSGTAASILFTGTPNSTVAYTINSTTNASINIGASGVATLNIPLMVTTTFNLVSVTLINPPSCTRTITGSTTMTVTQPPAAGSNAVLTICSNGAPQDLFALLGAAAQPGGTWSPVLHSGTNIFDPAFDTATSYVYTVAGTPPCVNDTALVTITIIPAPNAGLDGTANLCSNIDPIDLTTYLGGTPQTGGTWSPALASGTNMFDPMVDLAGPYIYTVLGTGSCGNDQATVTVNITIGPNAGTSASTTLCVNSTPINLFPLLGSTAEAGGTWSPALASGNDLFDPTVDAAGPYIYTLSGNQPCDNDTATITVNVNPLPDAGDSANTDICSNANPVDLLTRLGGTPQNGGTWSPALTSGTNMFDPSVDAAGAYTYTVGAPFCTPDISTLTINIVQGPEAGLPGAITFCINDPGQNLFDSLGGTPQIGGTWTPALTSGTGFFDPAVDTATVYTYTLSGNQPCDNDTATVTVTVNPIPDAGNPGPIQNVCNSQGTLDLDTLLTGAQTGGDWTDSNNVPVTNIVDVSTLAEANYSYTYTISNTCGQDSATVQFAILPNPTLTAANIGVSSPNCLGDNVTVTFNGMVDGAYVLNYNLSLSNILTNQNAPVTITGGTGTFTINANDIPNTGNTRITFLNITNATTSCTVPINPNVSADFIIRPTSNLDNVNLSIANVCLGADAIISITGATGLTDGNYQFVYSIPNGTPTTDTTASIAITGGAGQFIIPAATLSSSGNFTLTITSIVSLSGSCNNLSETANASFTVNPLPDLSNGVMIAGNSCLNASNEVELTTVISSSLPDGSYTITYDLSGAATATHTVTVIVVNGEGTFTIPAVDLNTAGNVTVTITQITSIIGLCNAATIGIPPITFEVTPLVETPVLQPDGEKFCAPENPTIANLTTNVTGAQNVTWYDAPNGGTAYLSTDLLVDGAIYYGAYVSAIGCESPTRLQVQVDLDQCDDIFIPDGFSPNGDGINDDFEIPNLAIRYPAFKLEIYNRYGNILYKGDINTKNWDGNTSEGGMNFGSGALPVGVYFYILEFNDGIKDAKQGRLYLSR